MPGDRKFAMEPFFAASGGTAEDGWVVALCPTPPTKRVTLVAVPKWLLLMRKSLPKVSCSTSPPDVRAVRRAAPGAPSTSRAREGDGLNGLEAMREKNDDKPVSLGSSAAEPVIYNTPTPQAIGWASPD